MLVQDTIDRIKEYVYPRRLGVKEHFIDVDPLRTGAVSLSRFVRGVSKLVDTNLLSEAEIKNLAKHFVRSDGDIDYIQFCSVIEEVFGPANLDKDPTFDGTPGAVDETLFSALTLVQWRMSIGCMIFSAAFRCSRGLAVSS